GPRPLQLAGLRARHQGHRRRGQRRRVDRADRRRPPPPGPDRLRAQLRPGDRPRGRRRPGLHGNQRCTLSGFPILTALVVLPAAAAVIIALVPRSRPEIVRALALLAAVLEVALAGVLLHRFRTGVAGFQLVSQHPWIKDFGISWKVGVDGISLFLVVLTAVLFAVAMAASTVKHDVKAFMCWMLVLEAGCVGVFLALDLFLFFIFWEVVLVPMYFIIGGWGYERRVYAALKFFLYTMLGSALMLVGILALVFLEARGGRPITFDLVSLANNQHLAGATAKWLFLAFSASFAVKVPLFPLHTWLPDAHTEAPTAGSVILAGVLLKLGT